MENHEWNVQGGAGMTSTPGAGRAAELEEAEAVALLERLPGLDLRGGRRLSGAGRAGGGHCHCPPLPTLRVRPRRENNIM